MASNGGEFVAGLLFGFVIGAVSLGTIVHSDWKASSVRAGLAHYDPKGEGIVYDAWKKPALEKKDCLCGCQN